MSNIEEIINELVEFRDDRNWEQFHNTKDLSLAISIEAAELNELFLWKTIEESEEVDKEKIKDELADIFAFAFLLANKHGFDVKEIVSDKVKKNGLKYPVEKSRDSATKYTDL
jgi:NTP pyrophosphatase (non-canonical NTP hydrolase)